MRRLRSLIGAIVVAGALPASAAADQLSVEELDDEVGFAPVEELSYEAIIDATTDHAAMLRIRVALHNGSGSPRDVVQSLALPHGARIVDLAVARDGTWSAAKPTGMDDEPGRRAPGTVWLRELPLDDPGDLPGAEIVAFGIEPDTTLQIEVRVRVYPRLRGGRWELELPTRGKDVRALARERRILVKGLAAGTSWWVDDRASGSDPFVATAPDETVTVSWPAPAEPRGTIVGRYDVLPGPEGFDDGQFRVVLRLGQTPAPRPDHVVFVVDRSRSTAARMQRDAQRVIVELLDALPAGTTFDAVGFARTAAPLLARADGLPRKVSDRSAREELVRALDDNERAQGTDLREALRTAGDLVRTARGRRPLVLVVTDGMLPASVDPTEVRAAFEAGLDAAGRSAGKRRAEVVFVVDDPLLERSGLPPDHRVAKVAATLGARISLKTLAQIEKGRAMELLSSPNVLGDLAIELPANMTATVDAPKGLVAGNVAIVRGRYVGKPASSVVVRGRFGARKIVQSLKATKRPSEPGALVAATFGLADDSVAEGFALPPWYRWRQQRSARQGITQAGLGYDSRGHLDDRIFKHYIGIRVMPRARVCYNRALVRDEVQAGRIVLEMEVGKGEVMVARAAKTSLTHTDPKLVECLTEAAWALDIPAAKLDDRMYLVRYPVRLIAPINGKAARVERADDAVLEVLLSQPLPARTPRR